jgi:NAD(P)-dependent dehydrogenase (short-subunit alcohol dehydrogenase family)
VTRTTPPRQWAGSTVVVTGAASGIGLRTVERFLDAGAVVVGLDRSEMPHDALDEARFLSLCCDVSRPSEVAEVAAAVAQRVGPCDVLVHCAGVLAMATVLETTDEELERVLSVNVRGAFLICRAFLPQLASRSGTLVAVASAAGLRPLPGLAAYSASKAAVVSLARSVALEYAADGVRSVCICPGRVDTPMGRLGAPADTELIDADDVASAILFVCSPEATHLSGAAIAIDDGRSLH